MRVNGANGSSCERGRARCSHVVLSSSVARRGCYGVMRDPWCYAQSGEVPEWRCERRDLLCVLYGRAWCEREDFGSGVNSSRKRGYFFPNVFLAVFTRI